MLTKFAKLDTTRDDDLVRVNYRKPGVDNRKAHKTAYKPSELFVLNVIIIVDV